MKKITLLFFLVLLNYIFNIHAQDLTVEKIWKKYEFSPKHVDGFNSMKDGEHFTKISTINDKEYITKHSFTNFNGEGESILNLSDLKYNGKKIEVDEYEFNENETKLLLKTETTPLYRRSYFCIYYLYDLSTKTLTPLDEKYFPQTLAEYSPDCSKVSFIHENNIYIKDLKSGKTKQITKDGLVNNIINGTTDWVYEEEFSITKGYYWSPDSKYIAFLKFNESDVKEFQLTYYGKLYPDIYKYKYPKAGEKNSKVTGHIYNVSKSKTINLDINDYEYIPRLKWSSTENNLIIQTLNRHQNHLKFHSFRENKGKFLDKIFFEEKSKTYVEIDDNFSFLKDGKSLIRTSEIDGYNHLYLLKFDGSSSQITKGNWDVIEFLGINEDENILYYTSAESGSINKSIYKIKLDGSSKKIISEENGYSDGEFSIGMKYFIKSYSNANTPVKYTLCNNEGKEIILLEENKELTQKMESYKLAKKEFITLKGTTTNLNAWIIKPIDFDPKKKYPVYIHVYGGPGHNVVTNSFGGNDFFYHQLLAQNGYIVLAVDPRGTIYRGAEFKKSTYLQLGKLEVEDVISTAKEISAWEFIDSKRIGIQGWSFGGYLTSLAMTKGADYFKMGIAVAPVTNWKYYDNIYTERFMRTPEENKDGYENNSPINYTSNIKGKYFIIHGSTDDNVHYQNSMDMVSSLTKNNIQFDMFIYPNKNHGIYGGNTRNHLYNMILDYTLKNL